MYWSAFFIGTVVFTAGAAPTLPKALLFIAVFGALAVIYAFVVTPYLKIGDRIYAMTKTNRTPHPDDHNRASS